MHSSTAPAATESGRPVQPAEWLAALILLAIGVFLRAQELTGHPLWIDEYGTQWVVAGERLRDVWWRAIQIQGQSPLYYLGVRGFVEVLGDGALALRLPSLLCGIALLVVGPALALRLFDDRRVALATLAAFALDERLIFYSQDARPYTLALLCALASFWFYAALRREPGWGTRIGWVLATAATWYVHYLFGIVMLVQGLHFVLWRPEGASRLRRDAGTLALLGVALAPGLWQLVHVFGRRQVLDWVPPADGPFAGLALGLEFVDLRLLAVVGVALLAALALERTRSLRLSGVSLGLLGLWLGVPLLLVWAASPLLDVNLIHARYVLVIVPALALLLGVAVGLPARARSGWILLLVFVAATGFFTLKPMLEGTGTFRGFYFGQHWEGATAALAEQYREGDVVFYGTKFSELDTVVTGQAPPVVIDFVSWPVRANLPAGRGFELRALPYRFTPQTRPALRQQLESAGGRVWLIGLSDPIRRTLPFAARVAGLQPVAHQRHGVVHLVLLGASQE